MMEVIVSRSNMYAPERPEDMFEPGKLVVSDAAHTLKLEPNIYLVTGPGRDDNFFAGIRISGRDPVEYFPNMGKWVCKPFYGSVLLSQHLEAYSEIRFR